jgi:hypothetical protein
MTQEAPEIQFAVSLFDCKEGDCVKIELSGAQDVVVMLSPQQARAFASELIQTVYRAEVKNSLHKKQQATSAKKTERAIDQFSAMPHHA